MPSFVISTATSTTQALNTGEKGIVTQSGSVSVLAAVGVSADGDSAVTVLGSVMGIYGVTHLDVASNFSLSVGQNGYIGGLAYHGVYLTGSDLLTLNSAGTIQSVGTAVYMRAETGRLQVNNAGLIMGGEVGLYVDASGPNATITNTGVIQGADHGIMVGDYTEAGFESIRFALNNEGTIIGTGGFAIAGSDGTEWINNRGSIVGYVYLDGGADYYDGRTGSVSTTVDGGDDADTLIGGVGTDVFDGGAGEDLLQGGSGDDEISGGAGLDIIGGGAGDDDLSGDEGDDVISGKSGQDSLYGGVGNDVLRGGSEADLLQGGQNNDTLVGGEGNDTLTGQGGADVFMFRGDVGFDRVTDFRNGVDAIDLTEIGVSSFGKVFDALTEAGASSVRLDIGALGGSGSVLIIGLSLAAADASDFYI